MRRPGILRLALIAAALAISCRGDDIDTEGVHAGALLEAAAARMETVQSFHFLLAHENGTSEIVRGLQMETAEGDVIVPDRMRMTVRARALGANLQVSIIVLPDQAFITHPITGRWEREEISLEHFFDPATGVTGLMRVISGAHVAGGERLDGVATYVVAATVDSGDLAFFAPDATPGRALPARAWIGVDDPLVHRLEIEGSVGPGEAEALVRRLTLSGFDAEIEITPPR